jgi:aspartyl-tRNA(Asn)/glutamyl-tRNA(Gln) amidotransferase subunit C
MIDERVVAHVARLGRLELTDEERRRFLTQLGSILEYFQTLNALNLEGVSATTHVRPITNVFRDDVPRPCLSQAEALANAPVVENGCFVVPPVIEEEQ